MITSARLAIAVLVTIVEWIDAPSATSAHAGETHVASSALDAAFRDGIGGVVVIAAVGIVVWLAHRGVAGKLPSSELQETHRN